MRSSAAARRYAKALFQLARDRGRVEEIGGELETLAQLFDESAELREVLLTPLYPADQRKRVLGAVEEQLGLSIEIRHFSAFLIDQRRILDFEAIREEYHRLAAEASGRMTAQVVSAMALDDGRRERLRQVLSDRTGRQIELAESVDPALIGGAIATVGDLVFDGSLRAQLGQLRANLMKES